MSNIVLFNPSDTIVANRVTQYLNSVNTPDYNGVTDKIINPNLSSVSGVDQNYWKVQDGSVVEMSAGEKTSMDTLLKAKTFREKLYRVLSYNDTMGMIETEDWYDTDNGDGTYSGKATGAVYVHDANSKNVISQTVTTYYYDGTVFESIRTSYFRNNLNQLIEKVEVL
jgi:hypothetical protein